MTIALVVLLGAVLLVVVYLFFFTQPQHRTDEEPDGTRSVIDFDAGGSGGPS